MSKMMLALLIAASSAIYDPPRVLNWVGPQAQTFGSKLKNMLDVNRLLPQLSQMGRR
jgi:hypothetical protein